MKNKITVAIPTYNSDKRILKEAIASVEMQEYPLKEIITSELKGIGKNLQKLMDECKTRYIIYLSSDDVFTHPKVLSDVVRIFDANPSIGVIGCFKYYFLDGHEGAIGVCRDKNILTSSCCPSGMAFRKMDIVGTNKIFVEMPSIVAQFLPKYQWTMLEYDTVACRYSPGVNTGTKTSYYTESPTQNWIDLLGCNYQDFPVFITLKNRAPKLLWREICLHITQDPNVLRCAGFWRNALIAVLVPCSILRTMTLFYRNRIARNYARIIERPNENNLN